MEQSDYYDILGIAKDASQEAVKESYRELAFTYHPDRNHGNPNASEKMKAINEAYAVLSNPEKRQQYDALSQQYGSSAYGHFRSSYSEKDIFRGSDIQDIFEEMAKSFGLRGFDDIFKEAYGHRYRSFQFGKSGFFTKGFIFTGPFMKGGQSQGPFPLSGGMAKLSRYFLEKLVGLHYP